MKTPFRALKEAGAPDEVVAIFVSFLLVMCLTPWLDISVGGITVSKTPWFVSLVAALIFVLLFVPCIPAKVPPSPAEKELRHRFEWLRRHLLVDNLTVDSAHEAKNALNGAGGVFRAAEGQFRDKLIEPILREAKGFLQWSEHVARLRNLCDQLPRGYKPGDMVQPDLALELKETVAKLPATSPSQQSAAAGATTRRG